MKKNKLLWRALRILLFIIILLCLVKKPINNPPLPPVSHFIEPDDTINYRDYHYVGAHNAHAYPYFFYCIYQQDQPTFNQLSYGIRGLMWDTYDFTLGYPNKLYRPHTSTVCLSHGTPGIIALTQKGNFTYQSLQYELATVLAFMKQSPQAVITIILEDYANSQATVDAIKETIKQSDYNPLLTPSNWQPTDNTAPQKWPTLGWMRHNNKRLIIFTQNSKNTDTTWNQFSYCIENRYATTNESSLCKERAESRIKRNLNRSLIIFNNFSWIPITHPLLISTHPVAYDIAQRVTLQCIKRFSKLQLFNGYFANRIIDSCNYLYDNRQKTVFELVNELNNTKIDQ